MSLNVEIETDFLSLICCSDYPRDVPSPGNSSHLSTKSDKNMADFEGEDVLSEEELAHINAHAQFVAATVLVRDTGHHTMQHHLANMASSYDVPLDKGGWEL